MKKVALLAVIAVALSACAQSKAPSSGVMDWSNVGGAKVAKVNNIKSLITPGFY